MSWESRRERPSAVIPAAMAPAASAAPRNRLCPRREARATPGSMPWDIASPRNAMPRRTTQVPAMAQIAETRIPAHSARWTKTTPKGSISASMMRHTTTKTIIVFK